MLTIQPQVTNSVKLSPAFGQRPEPRYQEIAEDVDYVDLSDIKPADDDDDEAKGTRAFWEEQKRQFDEAANDIALPKPVRKGAKIFAIVSEAAIDAIAVFCTGKMVIGGAQKALKSPKVQNVLTGGKAVRGAMHTFASGISNGASSLGRRIAKTDSYKAVETFLTTNKYAKPVTEGLKAAADVVSEKFGTLRKTVSAITAKQYNNAISGTIATGAGIAGAIDETDKYIKAQREEEIQEAA